MEIIERKVMQQPVGIIAAGFAEKTKFVITIPMMLLTGSKLDRQNIKPLSGIAGNSSFGMKTLKHLSIG